MPGGYLACAYCDRDERSVKTGARMPPGWHLDDRGRAMCPACQERVEGEDPREANGAHA